MCILLNIDDILSILPEKFSHGKIVVFIGAAQLVNLVAGLHGLILIHSSFYKSIVYFNLFLFLITFITNIIFIPMYGINGAALATFISILLFNAVRMMYVYKMNFQPFSSKTAITFLMIVAIYFGLNYIPLTSMALLNIVIRSLIVCVLVAFTVQHFKLSEDISSLLKEIRKELSPNLNQLVVLLLIIVVVVKHFFTIFTHFFSQRFIINKLFYTR